MRELCLSRDEVRGLTRTPQRVKQVEFLRRNGIRHYLDAHGWPVVLRSAVEGGETPKAQATTWAPRKAANG
jgi:hypothetical protein